MGTAWHGTARRCQEPCMSPKSTGPAPPAKPGQSSVVAGRGGGEQSKCLPPKSLPRRPRLLHGARGPGRWGAPPERWAGQDVSAPGLGSAHSPGQRRAWLGGGGCFTAPGRLLIYPGKSRACTTRGGTCLALQVMSQSSALHQDGQGRLGGARHDAAGLAAPVLPRARVGADVAGQSQTNHESHAGD